MGSEPGRRLGSWEGIERRPLNGHGNNRRSFPFQTREAAPFPVQPCRPGLHGTVLQEAGVGKRPNL